MHCNGKRNSEITGRLPGQMHGGSGSVFDSVLWVAADRRRERDANRQRLSHFFIIVVTGVVKYAQINSSADSPAAASTSPDVRAETKVTRVHTHLLSAALTSP